MKHIVWWPPPGPEELRAVLTGKLPPGTQLSPTPMDFRRVMNRKVWDLTRQAIEDAGDQARWEIGEVVRAGCREPTQRRTHWTA